MINLDRVKKAVVIIVVAGTLAAQGCSDKNSAEHSLKGIPLFDGTTETTESSVENPLISSGDFEQMRIETDQDKHILVIKYNKAGKEYQLDGKLLTYNCPETANVYRIIPSNEANDITFNPVEGWTDCVIQVDSVLTCLVGHNSETGSEEVLSAADRNSVNDSMTMLNNADYKQMEKIRSAFPDAVFGDYTLRYTYPATNTDLYEINYINTIKREDNILDTIKKRPFDYYVTRRVIDEISIGVPANVDIFYLRYNSELKQTTTIENDYYTQFYDGKDIYEVHCCLDNQKDAEVYMKDKPVLSIEQAFEKAKPMIINRLSEGKESHIFAAEMAYLAVTVYDMSNEPYSDSNVTSSTYDTYLYPFWIFYMHSNYKVLGLDSADRVQVIVNAVTGETIDTCIIPD